MTEQSMFFSDGSYYSQNVFARFIKDIFGHDGVVTGIDNELEVTANTPTNMAVNVNTGRSYIKGYFHEILTDAVSLTIPDADETNDRIDRIILRLDVDSERKISACVLEGTPASTPVAPTLTQTDSIYEISLYQVYVGANVTSITSGNLTDERQYMWMNYVNMPKTSTSDYGVLKVGTGLNVTNGVVSLGGGFTVNLSDRTLDGPKIGTASYTVVCTPSQTASSAFTPTTTETTLFSNLSIDRQTTTSSVSLCYGFNVHEVNIIPRLKLQAYWMRSSDAKAEYGTANISFKTTDGTLIKTVTGTYTTQSGHEAGVWYKFIDQTVSLDSIWHTLDNLNISVTGSSLWVVSSSWKFVLSADTNTQTDADLYLTT